MADPRAELRAAAEKATPGPWRWAWWGSNSPELVGDASEDREQVLVITSSIRPLDGGGNEVHLDVAATDAGFIAAASPDVVLALLDDFDERDAELAGLRAELEAAQQQIERQVDISFRRRHAANERDEALVELAEARRKLDGQNTELMQLIRQWAADGDHLYSDAVLGVIARRTMLPIPSDSNEPSTPDAELDGVYRHKAEAAEADLAEARRKLDDVQYLHSPTTVEWITQNCLEGYCDHDGECPEVEVTVCRECIGIAGLIEPDMYTGEVVYPCDTVRTLTPAPSSPVTENSGENDPTIACLHCSRLLPESQCCMTSSENSSEGADRG